MKRFNSIEKIAADLLSRFPASKSFLKKIYTYINFFIYKKNNNIETDLKLKRVLSSKNKESFFGYYDKSPADETGRYIIFHETPSILTHLPPDPQFPADIMIFDTKTSEYRKLSSSSAFNWQQGSRLMWLNKEKIIFNDFDKGNCISRIHNIVSGSIRLIGFPVYDCYKDEFALSLNFSRLNGTDKDYGYRNIKMKYSDDLENDGIYYIDLNTSEFELLFSIKKAIGLHYRDSMKNAKHCFNHIMISPNGKNFIFIHRWYSSGKRYDSLILSDKQGKNIKILSDDGFVSHCCWDGNENIIGYLQHYLSGRTFYRIDIITGKISILSEELTDYGDGHPSVFENKLIFDTYPDRSRMQHLMIFDLNTEKILNPGSFLSPLKFFGKTRCDLHPRWSSDGTALYLDSVHESKRILYYSKIKEKDDSK